MTRLNKTTILISLLLVLGLHSQAQEKWNINGKANLASFNLNLGNPIDFLGPGHIIFSGGGEFQFRRILNKKWEAQAGIGYNQMAWRNTDLASPIGEFGDFNNPVEVVDNNGNYTEIMWNVSMRYYRSSYGSFSPLGYYYKFGVTGTNGTIKTSTYKESSGGPAVSGTIPVSYIGLILGYGREYAITDNLFFGFGGDILLGSTTVDEAGAKHNSGYKGSFVDAHIEDFPFFVMSKNLFISHYSLSYLF